MMNVNLSVVQKPACVGFGDLDDVFFHIFSHQACRCKNTMDLKQKMIADANLEMERLSADIQKVLAVDRCFTFERKYDS